MHRPLLSSLSTFDYLFGANKYYPVMISRMSQK
jgi:hypothetical protein